MPRVVLAIVLALLTISVSGVSALVVLEPCTGSELAGQSEDDGACAPTCVTCGCCAQAVEPVALSVTISPSALLNGISAFVSRLPKSPARDILHVPKLHLA